MSTTLRQSYLRTLRLIGVKKFVTKSARGVPFVCHLGDFLGENPYYNAESCRAELTFCGAWLSSVPNPIVFDVGAHVGFFSTQLAQELGRPSQIYAFEPVPQTFVKLVQSIEILGLDSCVYPIAAAVLAEAQIVKLSYSPWNSLFSQVAGESLNPRFGQSLVSAVGLSLDDLCLKLKVCPSLIKIDIEGSEVLALRGARNLLSRPDRPAICFECNPYTLSERGWTTAALAETLAGYRIYYLDDFEGQKLPVGTEIEELEKVEHVCNCFAVPFGKENAERWNSVLSGLTSPARLPR